MTRAPRGTTQASLQSGGRLTRLALGLRVVLLLVLAGQAWGMTSSEFTTHVRSGHPRCLTVPDSVAVIRTRAATPGTPNAMVKAALDQFWNVNLPAQFGGAGGSVTNSEMLCMVAAWWLDGTRNANATATAACTTFFGAAVDANYDCNWPVNAQDAGGWWGDNSSVAAAYDLLYSSLNASRKRSVIRKLSTAMRINRYGDIDGSLLQYANGKTLPLLVIYGDSADVGFNAAIRDTLVKNFTFRENRCLPCWEAVETIGYGEQYWARRWTNQASANYFLRNALPGYDAGSDVIGTTTLFTAQRMANAGTFYRFAWRPGILAGVQGWASIPMERMPSKWDTDEFSARTINSFIGNVSADPYSWSLGEYLGRRNLDIGPINAGGITAKWQTVLWESPNRFKSYSWRNAPKYAWNPEQGVFFARSQWGIDSTGVTDSSIRVNYFPAYANAVGHFNAGHWNGMVGDANQIFDHGRRYTDFEDQMQFYHYFANSILIKTAGESFGSFNVADLGDADGAPCVVPTRTLMNGGWQDVGSAATGEGTWPECINNDANNPGRKRVYYRGQLIEDSVDPAASVYRISADADSAYDANEKRYVRRSWFYDGGNNVIVWDQVQVRSGVTDVHSVIGTINEPLCQDGTITVLRGAGISGAADSIAVDSDGSYGAHGGIYRVDGCTKIKHTNGNGRAWIYPLEVQNRTAASDGYLYVIGGRGKGLLPNGQQAAPWSQTKFPCAELTWSPTSNQTGFACWQWDGTNVLGTLLTPGDLKTATAWNMSPGAHTNGSCTQMTCSDGSTAYRLSGTDTTQPATQSEINNPNNNAAFGHGFDAGDWTIYATVSNPANLDVVEFVYLVHLQPTSGSEPTVAWERTGEVAAVMINSTMYVMTSPSTLTRPATISWDNPAGDANVTVKAIGLLPSVDYTLTLDGGSPSTVTTDAKGVASWSHSANGVSSFTLTLVTAGTGACCHPDGTCTEIAAGSCSDSYQGDGTSCTPNPCPAPFGACCFPDGRCEDRRPVYCAAHGGTWGGYGTDCTPNLCPQPTGACCSEDGSCSIHTADDCNALSGNPVYQGDDTICTPNPCPQPLDTGACCATNGDCNEETLADCQAEGGVFLGTDVHCSDDPAPTCYSQNNRACCLSSGVCVVMTEGNCIAANGTWISPAATCNLSCLNAPYGACCANDGSCTYVIESVCADTWQGGGVLCDPLPCTDYTKGACCYSGGCLYVSEADCSSLSGTYQGNGVPCSSDPCEADVVGACCYFNGSCILQSQASCLDNGGVYLGDQVACEFDLCGLKIILQGLHLLRKHLDD